MRPTEVDNKQRQRRGLSTGTRESLAAYAFLAPNFLGFLIFTSIPVIFSLLMAFTHWTMFKPPVWVGLENFGDLLWFRYEDGMRVANDPFFWQYLYNTVFLMAAIPIGMVGSLVLALMMNQKLRGIVVFRTIYFLPSVSSGVALLILWKYLYNADIGLINSVIRSAGAFIYQHKPIAVLFTLGCAVFFGVVATGVAGLLIAAVEWLSGKLGLRWREGLIRALTIGAGAVVFVLLIVFGRIVYTTISGFMTTPPDWLGTVKWAKPSLMLMGLWGGIGGANMILYLAALQGVPRSMYEAAEIDGAGAWDKFWAVTWPMISPTTFFILIVSIIGGFQSGFMVANVMTGGGPAGSTMTIEYYLYSTAFEAFNMGYACTIAWVLFAIIMLLTAMTWKLGGRVVTYE